MPIHCYCKKCHETKALTSKCCKCCDCSKAGETTRKVDKKKEKFCNVCCCVISKCKCENDKPMLGKFRPRMLTIDLPLYDERAHLLGYIKKGATIDEPACLKSTDILLEKGSDFCTDFYTDYKKLYEYRTPCCLSSCMYAQEVISKCGNSVPPRWTKRSAFNHAVGPSQCDCTVASDTILNRKTSNNKTEVTKIRKCPCP